jgi:Ca2+-binding EF-hand superfamily protein
VDSIPHSKAEIVFLRFQDAASASAAAGRPFLSLCSLTDLHLTGKMSTEDLLHTFKMMDLHFNQHDLDALLELLPNTVVGKDHMIEYRTLQNLLLNYSPRSYSSSNSNINNYNNNNNPYEAIGTSQNNRRAGDLPLRGTATTNPNFDLNLNSTPLRASTPNFSNTLLNNNNNNNNSNDIFSRSVATPIGIALNTPFSVMDNNNNNNNNINNNRSYLSAINNNHNNTNNFVNSSNQFMNNNNNNNNNNDFYSMSINGSSNVIEKMIRNVAEKLRVGIEEKNRLWGSNQYSLKKQFENVDVGNSGVVSINKMQKILMDVNVLLSTSELYALKSFFGKSGDDSDDDKIYYDSFCRSVENAMNNLPLGFFLFFCFFI